MEILVELPRNRAFTHLALTIAMRKVTEEIERRHEQFIAGANAGIMRNGVDVDTIGFVKYCVTFPSHITIGGRS